MLSSEVAQSLKSYGHLSDLAMGSRSLSVTALLNFSGKANTSIHGLGEDDKANCRPAREAPETQMTKNKRHSDLQARRNYHLFSKKRKR